MDLKIRQYLRAPNKVDTLEEYMKLVDKSKSMVMAAARNKYPYITQKTSSSSSAKSSPATRDDDLVTRSNTFTTKFRLNGNYTNSRNNRD
jgi:hypothetical protein